MSSAFVQVGLRILRSYPNKQGILLIDGAICLLEASYSASKDERNCYSQDDLLLAVIKSRRDLHLCFW